MPAGAVTDQSGLKAKENNIGDRNDPKTQRAAAQAERDCKQKKQQRRLKGPKNR